MSKIMFFGYGANKSRDKLSQVVGNPPIGQGAVVENFRLGYQSIDQIPEPARSVLQKIWGSGFKSYTLREGKGIIGGVLWEVSEEDFQKIKEWEFVGVWRELIEVEVKAQDGSNHRAFTEKAPEIHPIKGYEDGIWYSEYEFVNLEDKKDKLLSQYYDDKQLQKIRESIAAFKSK